jgi:hypothetical protein
MFKALWKFREGLICALEAVDINQEKKLKFGFGKS